MASTCIWNVSLRPVRPKRQMLRKLRTQLIIFADELSHGHGSMPFRFATILHTHLSPPKRYDGLMNLFCFFCGFVFGFLLDCYLFPSSKRIVRAMRCYLPIFLPIYKAEEIGLLTPQAAEDL